MEVSHIFEQLNKTIVLVTHDVFEAFEMCDRLCLLDDGKLQQVGTPKELLFRPANDFVKSFFVSDRFQLELLSVSLKDILKKVEQEVELYWSPPLEKEDMNIDPTLSIYEVIGKMEQATEENPVIISRVHGEVTDSIGFSDLLNRFQHYKKSIKTEGNAD